MDNSKTCAQASSLSNATLTASHNATRLLESTLSSLHDLSHAMYEYTPSSASFVAASLQTLEKNLKELEESASKCAMMIPMDVMRFVDDGKNPDLYMQEMVKMMVEKNEKANGRTHAFQKLKDELEKEISQLGEDVVLKTE